MTSEGAQCSKPLGGVPKRGADARAVPGGMEEW
jgi:hypothetical protein